MEEFIKLVAEEAGVPHSHAEDYLKPVIAKINKPGTQFVSITPEDFNMIEDGDKKMHFHRAVTSVIRKHGEITVSFPGIQKIITSPVALKPIPYYVIPTGNADKNNIIVSDPEAHLPEIEDSFIISRPVGAKHDNPVIFFTEADRNKIEEIDNRLVEETGKIKAQLEELKNLLQAIIKKP